MSWGSTELTAWMQDTSHSPLWPAQARSGIAGIPTTPDQPLPLLLQSSGMVPRHRTRAHGCCHGTVRELHAPAGWWLQGLPSRLCVPALHNLGSEENPDFNLSPGSTSAEGLSLWSHSLGRGNVDPSATAQRHKAQLLLLSVLAPQLLALGFIGAGAFPSVRLPLLVQAANADPLPPAHRDVLLHQACQHACRE